MRKVRTTTSTTIWKTAKCAFEHKSNKIVEFTHILLQSIYENVSKMPYGLRWVCRTLSDLIRKWEPDSTELDRNIMLGTVYEVVAAFYLQCRRKRPQYHHSDQSDEET